MATDHGEISDDRFEFTSDEAYEVVNDLEKDIERAEASEPKSRIHFGEFLEKILTISTANYNDYRMEAHNCRKILEEKVSGRRLWFNSAISSAEAVYKIRQRRIPGAVDELRAYASALQAIDDGEK